MKNLDSQGVCASLIIIIQIEGMSLSWPSHEALAHRVLARPFLTFTQPPHQQLLDVAAPRLARLSRRVSLRLLARSRPNMISRTSSYVTERTLGAFLVCRDQIVVCRSSSPVVRSSSCCCSTLAKRASIGQAWVFEGRTRIISSATSKHDRR